MRTTKTTPKGWMLTLLSALFLLSGLTACSSTEDSAEDSAKPKPEVPINDGDWQTVPATGGTIIKDSLSITFPSGSFLEDTKVAITEVQKGKTGGKYEASKFYQITLPTSLSQLVTFKVKSSEKSDDISFVAYSPGFCTSTLSGVTIETQFKTDYANGEYSSTIALVDEVEDNDNVSLTIGLAHIPSISSSTTRQTRGIKDVAKEIAKNIASNINTETLAEGKVKNVNYKIVIPLDTWSMYSNSDIVKLEMKSKKVCEYIEQAFNKIFDLGFTVPGEERVITITYREGNDWGGFAHSMWNKDWSTMTMGIEKLLNPNTTEEDIKSTIIHELFHFVQAGYDPRWSLKKGAPILVNRTEELLFCEMGAVWVEQFMNDNKLNAKFLKQEAFKFFNFYSCYGLIDYIEIWNKINETGEAVSPYGYQGYTMAPLLYYLCSTKEFEAWGLDNNSVVELHKLYKENFGIKTTLQILEKWVKDIHGYDLFFGSKIDEYYLKLFLGKLVSGFSLSDIKTTTDKNYKEKFNVDFDGKIYPFGWKAKRIYIAGWKDISLKNSELIVKQMEEGVQTYLLAYDEQNAKYYKVNKAATVGDSIVLNGETLESLRLGDGSYKHSFYLVTTRTENSISDKGSKPWKATIEIKDKAEESKPASVSPTSVSFEAEGGTDATVKITKGSYKYCNVDDIETPYSTWLSAKCSADGTVTIEAKPNTTTEERIGKVRCWVSNKENPSEADKKYLDPTITVTQKAGDGNSLLSTTSLEFPVEGGAKFIGYNFGTYLWMKRNWDDDTWLRTAWSKDYLNNISYNPSSDNRFANQLYVCCFPNETGKEREQAITFSYSMIKGFDFDTGDKFPVKIKQEGGSFNMEMMKNFFVGTWYTPQDITYSNGNYYHRRYTFRSDNTFTFEGQTTKSTSKPSSWEVEVNSTYSILNYEVKGECVKVYIKIPGNDGVWYKGLIERWPHFIFFAYENTDGSLTHGVYMEPE